MVIRIIKNRSTLRFKKKYSATEVEAGKKTKNFMKKFFLSMLALTVCAFTFVSCEKDKESGYEKDIVGTWQLNRYWDEVDGWDDDVENITYEFDKKGNITIRHEDSYEDDVEKYKYSISGNKIRFDYGEGDIEYITIESMSSNRMVWRYEEDGEVWKREFRKK